MLILRPQNSVVFGVREKASPEYQQLPCFGVVEGTVVELNTSGLLVNTIMPCGSYILLSFDFDIDFS